MNDTLVRCGIYDEDGSIIRCHVSIKANKVYVFSVDDVRSLDLSKYFEAGAHQPGIKTATALGRLVPPTDIPNMAEYPIPEPLATHAKPFEKASTSVKGQIAVSIVKELLKCRVIKLPMTITEITDRQMQISGTDILIMATVKIQVKCDWNAGPKSIPGCTGNLYIQTHECNPFGLH